LAIYYCFVALYRLILQRQKKQCSKLYGKKKMTIIVNGQERTIDEGATLLELLKKLDLEGKVMAVAVNMEIVKQDRWGEHTLNDKDKLELLDFVGRG